jgi:hypothetical protein
MSADVLQIAFAAHDSLTSALVPAAGVMIMGLGRWSLAAG